MISQVKNMGAEELLQIMLDRLEKMIEADTILGAPVDMGEKVVLPVGHYSCRGDHRSQRCPRPGRNSGAFTPEAWSYGGDHRDGGRVAPHDRSDHQNILWGSGRDGRW
jgi:hypothetical protein